MFKGFTVAKDVRGATRAKTSAVRSIRKQLQELYPAFQPYIDSVIPKKATIMLLKCRNRTTLIMKEGIPLFIQTQEKLLLPHLRLLHEFPFMMAKYQVDKGAIRPILRGSDVMGRGLTSPGGSLEADLLAKAPVAVFAEGKTHALMVGITVKSATEIRDNDDGVALQSIHALADGLWEEYDKFEDY